MLPMLGAGCSGLWPADLRLPAWLEPPPRPRRPQLPECLRRRGQGRVR